MVFCYKIVTDTPRRSDSGSPRKLSPLRKVTNVPTSLHRLLGAAEYENESVLDSVPEREWRLLAALARKREEDAEREKLAEHFRNMWQKEKLQRESVEAECSLQYKQYLSQKREQERSWHEYQRLRMSAEQHLRRGQLMDCISHKERRSKELLASHEDRKVTELVDKALEEEARAVLAAERRGRLGAAQRCRAHLGLAHSLQRTSDARDKRTTLLRHAAQRAAINNALSSWESWAVRCETSAMEATRRAAHAARAAATEQKSARLARERDTRLRRARRAAALTAQMREDLKSGRGSFA